MMSKDGSTLIIGSYVGTYVQVWEGQSPPTLTSVTIASNNSDTTKAKIGDTVTLTLTASETLSGNPTVVFTGASNSVTVINTSGNTYTASYVVASNDTDGTLAFTIDFTSSGGVAGTQVTSITSGSNVTIFFATDIGGGGSSAIDIIKRKNQKQKKKQKQRKIQKLNLIRKLQLEETEYYSNQNN